MKVGNLKILNSTIFLFIFIINNLHAEEKINLNVLQPTFEEEAIIEENESKDITSIKSKKKQSNTNNKSIVKFKALDKITAKTNEINIVIGQKKRFGYLEIHPRRCSKFEDQNNKGVAAYIQVKDLNISDNERVFIFNGWTFSSTPTLNPFDHPVYDLWLSSCKTK